MNEIIIPKFSALLIDNLSYLFLYYVLGLYFVRHSKQFIKLSMIIIITVLVCFVSLFEGHSLLFIVRGITGGASITTLLVLAVIACNLFFKTKFIIFTRTSAIVVLVAGILLYTSSLGLIPFDIYDYGFMPNKYFLLILLLVLLFIARTNKVLAVIMLLAIFAYYFKLQLSVNIWDYLLNPLFILFVFRPYTLSDRNK